MLSIKSDYSRSTRRTLRHTNGKTETIDFLLTKSQISGQKRGRMFKLVKSDNCFARLLGSAWADPAQRHATALTASSPEPADSENILVDGKWVQIQDYEAVWSIFQAIIMDAKYLTPTEYNLFDLIRVGNECLRDEPVSFQL